MRLLLLLYREVLLQQKLRVVQHKFSEYQNSCCQLKIHQEIKQNLSLTLKRMGGGQRVYTMSVQNCFLTGSNSICKFSNIRSGQFDPILRFISVLITIWRPWKLILGLTLMPAPSLVLCSLQPVLYKKDHRVREQLEDRSQAWCYTLQFTVIQFYSFWHPMKYVSLETVNFGIKDMRKVQNFV